MKPKDNLERWKTLLEGSQDNLAKAIEEEEASKGHKWSQTAAICQDKVNVLEGKPTSISATIGEHRSQIPALIKVLALVGERIKLTERLERLGAPPGEQGSIKGRDALIGSGENVSPLAVHYLDGFMNGSIMNK